jgi:hypothetical protein
MLAASLPVEAIAVCLSRNYIASEQLAAEKKKGPTHALSQVISPCTSRACFSCSSSFCR